MASLSLDWTPATPPTVSLEEAQPSTIFNLPLFEHFLVLDLRPAAAHAAGHIATALSCPSPPAGSSSSSSSEAALMGRLVGPLVRMVVAGDIPEDLSRVVLCTDGTPECAAFAGWLHTTLLRGHRAKATHPQPSPPSPTASSPSAFRTLSSEEREQQQQQAQAQAGVRTRRSSSSSSSPSPATPTPPSAAHPPPSPTMDPQPSPPRTRLGSSQGSGPAPPPPPPPLPKLSEEEWVQRRLASLVDQLYTRCKRLLCVQYEGFAREFPFLCKPGLELGDLAPTPTIVTGGLLLGTSGFEASPEALAQLGITHVITHDPRIQTRLDALVGHQVLRGQPHVAFLVCAVRNRNDETMGPCWDQCVQFIDDALASSGRVLVQLHDRSRSASVVLAFLMRRLGWRFERALEHVRALVSIDVTAVYSRQLQAWAAPRELTYG